MALVGIVAIIGISEPVSAQTQSKPAATVRMTNGLKFKPYKVTVKTGETVLWKNPSKLIHTVTFNPKFATEDESVRLPPGAEPFGSGFLKPDESFRHTFTTPGTYKYFCRPHESSDMYGKVVVEPAD
ncbi:MAG: plastocyanin/azurin family copper-binding protein [Bradymonadaceae bacterium]